MGDAAKIRAAVVRKQKTDARDAAHLLDMLCTNRFPTIWRPSLEERDLRQPAPLRKPRESRTLYVSLDNADTVIEGGPVTALPIRPIEPVYPDTGALGAQGRPLGDSA